MDSLIGKSQKSQDARGESLPLEAIREALEGDEALSAARRREVLDRLTAEFGEWLRGLDAVAVQRAAMKTLLEEYDVSIHLELSARPRSGKKSAGKSSSLKLVPRRK